MRNENLRVGVYTKKEIANKVEMLISEIEDKDLECINVQIEQIQEILKEQNKEALRPLCEQLSEAENAICVILKSILKIEEFKEKYL